MAPDRVNRIAGELADAHQAVTTTPPGSFENLGAQARRDRLQTELDVATRDWLLASFMKGAGR
jgi:hypothetical protein